MGGDCAACSRSITTSTGQVAVGGGSEIACQSAQRGSIAPVSAGLCGARLVLRGRPSGPTRIKERSDRSRLCAPLSTSATMVDVMVRRRPQRRNAAIGEVLVSTTSAISAASGTAPVLSLLRRRVQFIKDHGGRISGATNLQQSRGWWSRPCAG
jgi:hypothetical protein